MAKKMGSKQTKTNTKEVSMKIDENISHSSKLSTNSAENSSGQWLQSRKCSSSYVNWLLETRASEAQKLLVKNSTDLEDDYKRDEFQESNSTEVDEQYENYSMLDYPNSNQITYYEHEELGDPRKLLKPTENMKRYYLQEELKNCLQEKYRPPIKLTSVKTDDVDVDSLLVQYECSSSHLSQNLPSVFSNCSISSSMSDEYGGTTGNLNNEEYISMEELGLGFLKDGNWIPTDVIAKTIWKKLETSLPAGSVQAKWNRSSKTFPENELVEIENKC